MVNKRHKLVVRGEFGGVWWNVVERRAVVQVSGEWIEHCLMSGSGNSLSFLSQLITLSYNVHNGKKEINGFLFKTVRDDVYNDLMCCSLCFSGWWRNLCSD